MIPKWWAINRGGTWSPMFLCSDSVAEDWGPEWVGYEGPFLSNHLAKGRCDQLNGTAEPGVMPGTVMCGWCHQRPVGTNGKECADCAKEIDSTPTGQQLDDEANRAYMADIERGLHRNRF